MTPTYEIETQDQFIAILGDPRRMRILEILTKQQASVKGLAEMMGETPQTTHYHTKQLQKAGLIRIVDAREVKGIVEKFYRAVAERFLLNKAIGEGFLGSGMETWLRLVQEMVQLSDYYVESVESADAKSGFAGVQLVGSDRETMKAFEKRLGELQAEFKGCEREGAGERYVLAVGLFPTDPNIALPEDPGAFLSVGDEAGDIELK